MVEIEGRVVAVTGGGRGIGLDIALLCAREGAVVVVNDLGAEADGAGGDVGPAEETVHDIQREGGRAMASGASVADPVGAASNVRLARQVYG